MYNGKAHCSCKPIKQKPKIMIRHLEGLKKVSVNATKDNVDCFKTLVKDIMHGREMLVEPGLSVFTLSDGTIFEFYGLGSHFPDYLFSHTEVVNSYGVPDLHLALEQLEKQGARLLGQIVHMSASCCYCHLSLEDGSVMGLFQYNEEIA